MKKDEYDGLGRVHGLIGVRAEKKMCNEEKWGTGGEGKQVLWLTGRFMEFGTEHYPTFSEFDGKTPINFNHAESRSFPGYPKESQNDYRGAKLSRKDGNLKNSNAE